MIPLALPRPLTLMVTPRAGHSPLAVKIQVRAQHDPTYRLLVLQSYCGVEEYPDNEKIAELGDGPIPLVEWTLRCSDQSLIHGFIVDQNGKKVKNSGEDVPVITY